MANEEQLVIDVVAKLNELEKQMARANRITARAYREMSANSRKATKQMENDAVRSAVRINQALATIGNKIGGYGAAFGAGIAANFTLRGAKELIDSSTRISNALKVAGLEGEQLTSVYNSLFKSAQRNAAPLEALVTLYGRASLVQKELKVSTTDLLNFTDKVALALRVSGQSAQESSGALLQLSQALGSGIVRAEEFNSILEGALPIAQATAAGLKEAGGSVAKLRQLVVDGKVSSEAFFKAFEAGAVILEDKVANSELTVSQGFVRLQNVLIDTAGKINDVTGASGRVGSALQSVAHIVEAAGVAIRNFADSDLGHLADRIYTILNPIDKLINKLGGLKNLPLVISTINEAMFKAASGEPISDPKPAPNIRRIAFEALGSTGKGDRVIKPPKELTDEQISDRINAAFGAGVKQVSLADYPVDEKEKKKRKTGGSKSHSKTADQQIDSDVQAIRDRTEALKLETELVGKSYYEAEKRRMSLDLEQKALAKLKDEAIKKGQTDLSNIQISAEQRAQIDAVSEAYARQADELRRVEESQIRAEQAAGDFYETFKSSVTGAITGANSLSDALQNILNKLSDLLLSSAFDALFKPSSGGAGGGSFGNIFSSLGSLITGAFADGTNFAPGGPALVGERGPEIVELPRGSKVTPNHMLGQSGSGGGSQNVNVQSDIRVSVDKDGNLQAYVTNQSAQVAQKAVDRFADSNEFKVRAAHGAAEVRRKGGIR